MKIQKSKMLLKQLITVGDDISVAQSLIAPIFINTELICLMKRSLKNITDVDQLEFALIKLRKILKQTNRKVDAELYQLRPYDYHLHMLEIKQEQKKNDPIKWVEAELEYLLGVKKDRQIINAKKIWTMKDIQIILNLSASKIYEHISNGMPNNKLGGTRFFIPDDIIAWIKG